MITVDPSAAVSRPKDTLISSDTALKLIIPIARDLARGGAIRMSRGEDDHV